MVHLRDVHQGGRALTSISGYDWISQTPTPTHQGKVRVYHRRLCPRNMRDTGPQQAVETEASEAHGRCTYSVYKLRERPKSMAL